MAGERPPAHCYPDFQDCLADRPEQKATVFSADLIIAPRVALKVDRRVEVWKSSLARVR